jgi:hypothetical protein
MWWSQLLAGLVAGGLTLSGVWLTQRRSDKREALAWTRQRKREEEVWAREDAARSYEHRREAYAAFSKQWNTHLARAESAVTRGREIESDVDWTSEVFDACLVVELYGTAAATEAALNAVNGLSMMFSKKLTPDVWTDLHQRINVFTLQARVDLKIAD